MIILNSCNNVKVQYTDSEPKKLFSIEEKSKLKGGRAKKTPKRCIIYGRPLVVFVLLISLHELNYKHVCEKKILVKLVSLNSKG